MKYEDRLVAFIDILGFKNLVGETVDAKGIENTDKIAHLYESYEIIQKNWSDAQGLSESKRVTIFSDCIVVSVKISETSQIFWTLIEIKHLIMQGPIYLFDPRRDSGKMTAWSAIRHSLKRRGGVGLSRSMPFACLSKPGWMIASTR